jgi:hypothetical protein
MKNRRLGEVVSNWMREGLNGCRGQANGSRASIAHMKAHALNPVPISGKSGSKKWLSRTHGWKVPAMDGFKVIGKEGFGKL